MKKPIFNKLVLFTLFYTLTISCSTKIGKNNISLLTLKKEREISILSDSHIESYPLFYFENDSCIYFTSDNEKKLISFDINTGNKKNEIDINFFKYQQLLSFYYLNDDSVFLAFNSAFISHNEYQDSSVMLINNKGKIKKVFSFEDSPILSSYNSNKNINSLALAPPPFADLYYYNNKVFFSLLKYLYNTPGDSLQESIKIPLAGHQDLIKNKFVGYNNLKGIPYFKKGRYYHRNYRLVFLALTPENYPLIAFRHTPILYEYNYNNKTYKTHRIKSLLVDTIIPDNSPIEACSIYNQAFYGKLIYDKYRHLYYRFIQLPANNNSPSRKNNPKISMIVADTLFKIKAEGILPDNLSQISVFTTKEGIWFYNKNEKNKINFQLYSLHYNKEKEPEKKLFKEYAKKTILDKNIGIQNYVTKTFGISDKNYAAVIVPVDIGCHYCASSIVKFYKENISVFENNNIFLILLGLSKNSIDPFLTKNNIKENMPHLYIDNKGEYQNYIEGFNNPKLYIINNLKLTSEKLYKPAELINLEIKLKDYASRK